MKERIAERFNTMIKEAKRPFAYLIALCMVVTLIPLSGFEEAVYAAPSSPITTDYTLDADDSWPTMSISSDVTLSIPSGITLTMTGNLTLGDNVTITGGGTINLTQNSYIIIRGTGDILQDITITSSGSRTVSLIADDLDANDATITFDSVIIEGAEMESTSSLPSAFLFNLPTKSHKLYLKGNTVIRNNTGGQVGAVGSYESTYNCKIYVQDSVKICDNFDKDGNSANIIASSTTPIEVSGDLSENADIGVTPADYSNAFATLGGSVTDSTAARDAFFIDDFLNYGVDINGSTLKPTAKSPMTVSYGANGSIEAKDAKGRSIVSSSGGGTATLKEIPGRTVALFLIPQSETYFVKGVTIGGVDRSADLVSYEPANPYKKSITFSAIASGVISTVFEKAVTDVNVNGIIAPYGYLEAGDSLSGASIGLCDPASASVAIASKVWKKGGVNMTANQEFDQGDEYGLVLTLTASGGSKFAQTVSVSAAGVSGAGTSSNNGATLTVELEYTAAKMPLTIAESLGYVTFTVNVAAGNATYDGLPHGPEIIMVDKKGGTVTQNSSSATVGGESKPFSVNAALTDPTDEHSPLRSTVTINGSVNAGSYAAGATIVNNIYEGSKEFVGLSYTISRKKITPTGIDLTGSRKYYDGTKDVTVGGITFEGLESGDNLVKGTDYTAAFAFDNASASAVVGDRTVVASDIALKITAIANNYTLGSSNTTSQIGATIDKTVPEPRENSFSFTPVNSVGTQIGSIGFQLSSDVSNWFQNIYNAMLNIGGVLSIVDPSTDSPLDGGTVIEKNTAYRWKFVPTDTTDYTNRYGDITLWPVEPIKAVTLSGIAIPTFGAVNAITTAGLTAVTTTAIGPSAGSGLSIVDAKWFEYNPNTNTTSVALAEGYTFKYHRTYTLVVTMVAATGDKFATGGALAVDFTTDGATYHMTAVQGSISESQVTFRFSAETGKGTMTDSMFTVPGNQEVTYNGAVRYCTIASIVSELDDGFLEYRTATNGAISNATWTSYAGANANLGLSGYRDAGNNMAYVIELRHPDYVSSTGSDKPQRTYTITISPKAIETAFISAIEKRPYDATTTVNVSLSSVDIIDGDSVVLTADSATISSKDCTTASVTVNASLITMSGIGSSNYTLKAGISATTSGALNVIQKVTPTVKTEGESITYAAVTSANPRFSDLSIAANDYINEYITGANGVSGTIENYYNPDFSSKRELTDNVIKRHEYYWIFKPTDSTNYNEVTGSAVYWQGAPITNATLTGIEFPVAMANPTAKSLMELEVNDPTAEITIEAIEWREIAPSGETWASIEDRILVPAAGDKFYYNRLHTLTVTLSSVGTPDEFNYDGDIQNPTFAGIVSISGVAYPCTTTLLNTGTPASPKYERAVVTCTFGDAVTDKGTLTNDNLDARDFASYYRDGTLYKNDLRGEGNLLTYVYTGRRVGPYPKSVSLQAVDIQSIKYSTGGGLFNAEVPLYSEVMSNGQPKDIQIQLTHPDYNGTIEKDVQLYIGPCYVRAEGVIYGGKYYDGTKDIDANVAKILWAPTLAQSSTNEGITSEEIGRLITYDAQYEFGDERAGSAKDVYVSNIHFISTNFLPQYANIPEKGIGDAVGNQVNGSFTYHSSAPSATPIPISKATVTPKTGSILKQPINSAVSLSAVYTDYIINHSNASTGAVMVNAVRSSLDVHGSLDFMSGGAIMSYADMDSATLVQGQAYTWRFTPTDAVNYAVTTGTQILWPFPPPAPSYGGGGGGGAAAPTKAAVSTLSGVIATPGSFSTQIHVYWASGGSIVTDKAFLARVTGAAVDRALTAMPDGNIVVDRDGNIIVKAIIEGGILKAYLTGDNYLTIQRRKVDYIDVPGHWFEPYVDFCSARDIMNGTGESKFSPNDTLTRAMAATIIYRLEGALALDGSERHFADVEDGKWYSDGIAWAGGNGIVNGIGIKNFAPHWDITREQLAVMIYNYCRTRCGAEAVPSGYFDARLYNDGGQIASWAQEAVAYCSKVGLMKGNDKGDFCPKDTATRAEFATITQRLIEAFLDGTL